MIAARDDGLIGAVGLSNITVSHLTFALQFTDIVCVQNPYHLANRSSQPVLDECARHGIAFVPFAPLGSGSASVLSSPQVLHVATRLRCTPAQVALAWTLDAAPNVVLIPGTSSRRHFREKHRRIWSAPRRGRTPNFVTLTSKPMTSSPATSSTSHPSHCPQIVT
jgi:diketogulonate reductase-like aldo/keto reductase